MSLQENMIKLYSVTRLLFSIFTLLNTLIICSAIPRQTTEKSSLMLPAIAITTITLGILYKACTKITDQEALINACCKNDLKAVERLLQKKVALDNDEPYNESVLMIAAAKSCPEINKALLQAKANVHAQSISGETAFYQAVKRNYSCERDSSRQIMSMLLEHKANINHVQPWYQETPLMSTLIHSCDNRTLEFLLRSGADYAVYKNRDGFTAEQLIKQIGKPGMLAALNQRKKDDKEKFSAELHGLFVEKNLVATSHSGILAAFYGLPNPD